MPCYDYCQSVLTSTKSQANVVCYGMKAAQPLHSTCVLHGTRTAQNLILQHPLGLLETAKYFAPFQICCFFQLLVYQFCQPLLSLVKQAKFLLLCRFLLCEEDTRDGERKTLKITFFLRSYAQHSDYSQQCYIIYFKVAKRLHL